jgi:hypothetical protein
MVVELWMDGIEGRTDGQTDRQIIRDIDINPYREESDQYAFLVLIFL